MFTSGSSFEGCVDSFLVDRPASIWKCHKCDQLRPLKHNNGAHVFRYMKCNCGHTICTDCDSNTLDLDPDRRLRTGDPLSVAPYATQECPYFSVCPRCGLSHRAKDSASGGIFKAPARKLTFKVYGDPCDSCGLEVTSTWIRASIMATSPYGVSSPDGKQHQSLLRAVTNRAGSTLRSRTRQLTSKSSHAVSGEASAAPRRNKWSDDDNLPSDWECIRYDGSIYYYRDGNGNEYKTEPGNRYGPFARI